MGGCRDASVMGGLQSRRASPVEGGRVLVGEMFVSSNRDGEGQGPARQRVGHEQK